MLWRERQEKVEGQNDLQLWDIEPPMGLKIRMYRCDKEFVLEPLEAMLEVDVPFYPEVYWIGRKLKFEELGLPYKYKEYFDESKKGKRGVYLANPKVILLGGYFLEDIGEESGHFLHLNSSGIREVDVDSIDGFCLGAIVEMFGFFCSKLIKPSRKNYLSRYKDDLPENPNEELVSERINSFFELSHEYEINSEIYYHGYQLGQNLFDAYISKVISKDKMRKLFHNSLKEKGEPTNAFMNLKYNLVEFMNNN